MARVTFCRTDWCVCAANRHRERSRRGRLDRGDAIGRRRERRKKCSHLLDIATRGRRCLCRGVVAAVGCGGVLPLKPRERVSAVGRHRNGGGLGGAHSGVGHVEQRVRMRDKERELVVDCGSLSAKRVRPTRGRGGLR